MTKLFQKCPNLLKWLLCWCIRKSQQSSKIKFWSMSSFNSFQNTLFLKCIFNLKAVYLLVQFFSLCVNLYNFMREIRAPANITSQSLPANLHRQAMVCDRKNNGWRVKWSFIQLPAHTWINPLLFWCSISFICIGV